MNVLLIFFGYLLINRISDFSLFTGFNFFNIQEYSLAILDSILPRIHNHFRTCIQ